MSRKWWTPRSLSPGLVPHRALDADILSRTSSQGAQASHGDQMTRPLRGQPIAHRTPSIGSPQRSTPLSVEALSPAQSHPLLGPPRSSQDCPKVPLSSHLPQCVAAPEVRQMWGSLRRPAGRTEVRHSASFQSVCTTSCVIPAGSESISALPFPP